MNKESKEKVKSNVCLVEDCVKPTHKESQCCIFHASAEEKTEEEFKEALKKYVRNIKKNNLDYNFIRFIFIGDIDFKDSTFKNAKFLEVIFEGPVSFFGAIFEESSDFGGATFNRNVEFGGEALFKGDTSFACVTFEENVDFGITTFKKVVIFEGATFKGEAGFGNTNFEKNTRFSHATFKKIANFNVDVIFKRNAEFDSAIFKGQANFLGATFKGQANFWGATFEKIASFSCAIFKRGAKFWESTFEGDVSFWDTTFEGDVNFNETTFPSKKIIYLEVKNRGIISFVQTFLENIVLRLDLEEKVFIDFTNAILRNTKIEKKEINGHILQEQKKEFSEAKEIYLLLKNNFHSIGRYEDESWAFKKEKDMERKNYFHFRTLHKWLWSCFLNGIFGYGEQPGKVIISAISIILIFTFLFMNSGISSSIIGGSISKNFLDCVYFSAITFTTLGYGDFRPLEGWGRVFSGAEAFIGALMMALFVYTFARRTGGR